MPGKRKMALSMLAERQEGITSQHLASVLDCDENTATRILGDLIALGLAGSSKPINKRIYYPSSKFHEMATLIYLDEFESPTALQKLFDLPISVTPQRERESVTVG